MVIVTGKRLETRAGDNVGAGAGIPLTCTPAEARKMRTPPRWRGMANN